MNNEVLYSISYFNMPIEGYVFPIIFFLFVILIIKKGLRLSWVFALIILGFFVVAWPVRHISHVNSLNSGDYEVVEGKVEKYRPASKHPKGFESFEVSGKSFDYRRSSYTGGLYYSLEDTGLIKNGANVKIFHKYGSILKIEVKK